MSDIEIPGLTEHVLRLPSLLRAVVGMGPVPVGAEVPHEFFLYENPLVVRWGATELRSRSTATTRSSSTSRPCGQTDGCAARHGSPRTWCAMMRTTLHGQCSKRSRGGTKAASQAE